MPSMCLTLGMVTLESPAKAQEAGPQLEQYGDHVPLPGAVAAELGPEGMLQGLCSVGSDLSHRLPQAMCDGLL